MFSALRETGKGSSFVISILASRASGMMRGSGVDCFGKSLEEEMVGSGSSTLVIGNPATLGVTVATDSLLCVEVVSIG